MPDLCNEYVVKNDGRSCLQCKCKVGGIVHCRQNDIATKSGSLCKQAFTPSAVNYEPFICSEIHAPLKRIEDAAATNAVIAKQQHNAIDGLIPMASEKNGVAR